MSLCFEQTWKGLVETKWNSLNLKDIFLYVERSLEGKGIFSLKLFILFGESIYKSKWTGKKTKFQQFKTEFGHFIKSLTGVKNQKAIKTMQNK